MFFKAFGQTYNFKSYTDARKALNFFIATKLIGGNQGEFETVLKNEGIEFTKV